jgi:hypothetical protein
MSRPVRIANAQGFWGDRTEAAREMLALEPELDFLTLDFLAEVSMSILALQRSRDPEAGWPRDFLDVVRSIAPYWRHGGRCRVITNAGGLNPLGCARACADALRQAGCTGRTIAVVSGDDVLDLVRNGSTKDELLQNMDTGRPIADIRDRLLTANAYLGAQPVAAALQSGADLVIAGRLADPSLTLAACAHWFGWKWDDWDRLAGGTIAGHLIECGTQLTGGIATDWLETPDVERIGFPIAEVAADGSCIVAKPRGSGGRVCRETVKEQLVYEIGDPDAYLSPDATVSLLGLQLDGDGEDRVCIGGARGRPAPPTYKVSATYQDGFRAQGQLTVFGRNAVAKARRAGHAVLSRLSAHGVSLREAVVECLGAGACRPQGVDPTAAQQLTETVLRIAVADGSREAVERFTRELMPLVTAGPPGTTGYAEGRPRVHPLFRFWPCLIERDRVNPRTELLPVAAGESAAVRVTVAFPENEPITPVGRVGQPVGRVFQLVPEDSTSWKTRPTGAQPPQRLGDIAYGRSGDKGINANIGLVARRREDFSRLLREVTPECVASYFGLPRASLVTRYELPNLDAVNLIVRGILANPLRVDAQGKALAQVLLEMPLEETL